MIKYWLCRTCSFVCDTPREAFNHRAPTIEAFPHHIAPLEEKRLTGIEKESLHAEIHLIARNYGS